MSGLLLFTIACIRPPGSPLVEEEGRAWRVELALEASPPGPSLGPPSEESLRLRLVGRRLESMVDGSERWGLFFEEARRGPAPGDRLPLEGQPLELRRFPEGELLGVHGLERLSGSGGQLEALGVLPILLSPDPPALEPGEEGRSALRLPLHAPQRFRWQEKLDLQWRREPGAGPWTATFHGAHGAEARSEPATGRWTVRARGELQGRLERSGEADRTTFSAWRELDLQLGSGQWSQQLRYSGSVESREVPPPTLPQPLRGEELRAAVAEQIEVFAPCRPADPPMGGLVLPLTIDAQGQARSPEGQGCWAERASSLRFRPQPEADLKVELRLGWDPQGLRAPMQVADPPLPEGPFALWLPASWSAAQRRAAWQAAQPPAAAPKE